MGGTIAMIIRKPDGEVVPMLRWTNILPYYMAHPDLLDGNFEAWWPKFSKEWEAMRSDWERNKNRGTFENNMTSVYHPHDANAPEGYGLVVVDFHGKNVLHVQGYCSLGQENLYSLFRMDADERAMLKRRIEAGYLMTLHLAGFPTKVGSRTSADLVEVDLPLDRSSLGLQKACGEVVELCQGNHAGRGGDVPLGVLCSRLGLPVPVGPDPEMRIDLSLGHIPLRSAWKFNRFEETPDGIVDMRMALGKLGFHFTPEDDLGWQKFVVEHVDGEPDDCNEALARAGLPLVAVEVDNTPAGSRLAP